MSAIVTPSTTHHASKSAANSKDTSDVIDTLEDDSDNEAEAHRLLRSQIIDRFWKQHEANNEELENTETENSEFTTDGSR